MLVAVLTSCLIMLVTGTTLGPSMDEEGDSRTLVLDETDDSRILTDVLSGNTTSLADFIANISPAVAMAVILFGVLYVIVIRTTYKQQHRRRPPAPAYGDYSDYDYEDDFARRTFVGDFTEQIHLLSEAFSKYEVEETTCQLYVACESAHTDRHQKHGRLAKIVHQVLDTISRPENFELFQDDAYLMDLLDGFKTGVSGQSCSNLRKSCRKHKVFLDQ